MYRLQRVVPCERLYVHPTTQTMTTGSVAEFYTEPMLPHVGDVDVIAHPSTWLAIPQGHTPLTQLPAEFSDYVKVYEIVDSDFPG